MMLELLDFIFENLFILVLIISGLLSFLKTGKKQGDRTSPSGRPARKSYQPPRPVAAPVFPTESRKKEETVQTVSIEEMRQEQLEKLAGQLSTNIELEDIEDRSQLAASDDLHKGLKPTLDRKQDLTEKQKTLKKQMSGNITSKGLVNGIIMSEVLGPPRARKPYRSIIEERYIK